MMKTSFSMILYYFLMSIIGTLAAAFIFMVCCNLTLLVAGEASSFFCTDFYIRGILVSIPLVLIVTMILVVLYGIRHREHPFFRLLTYVFLGAFTWLVLIPFSFDLNKKYEERFAKTYEVPYLTAGFFRPESGGVFYFSRVHSDGTADGLYIDLTGITGEKGTVVKFSNSIIDADFAGQFADTLVRDSIKMPFIIIAPLEIYSLVMQKAHEAYNSGFVAWLVFVSFALALLSCIAFENTSSWNLICALLVFFSSLVVCAVNYIYYKGYIFYDAAVSWNSYCAEFINSHTGFLAKIFAAQDMLLAVINLIIFAVFTVIGVLLFIFNRKSTFGELK